MGEIFLRGDRAVEKRKGKPPAQITEVWTGAAVEITPGEPRRGRIRLAHLLDGKSKSVVGFARRNVVPMSSVFTDG